MKNHTTYIERIKSGEPFDSVLIEWGINRSYALSILRKSGIDTKPFRKSVEWKPRLQNKVKETKSFVILAEILKNRDRSLADIAASQNVTRQFAHTVKRRAEQVGIL